MRLIRKMPSDVQAVVEIEVEEEEEPQPAFTAEQREGAEAQILEQTKRIDFYITEYSVELLVAKMGNGDFFVPSYQREFTWEAERKSRFLESLIMGLPIPFLFFWEDPDSGRLEVVDGSQRLRTLQQFVSNEFALGRLEELSALEGFRFSDLSESRQRKVKNRSIRGIILGEHADEEARFDLFDRINTGSKAANKAEVRRGALGGPFLELVIELANDTRFKRLAPMSQSEEDLREREELVTRFFVWGDGLEGYKDRVSPFVYAYTKRMNDAFDADPNLRQQYADRFHRTMAFVERNFPNGFRRNAKGRSTPRARFEAIAIGSHLALTIDPAIAEREINTEWVHGEDFKRIAGSGSANITSKLRGRLEFVRDRLTGRV